MLFIHENWKDTSNSTENIIKSKFHEWKKFRLVVLLVVIMLQTQDLRVGQTNEPYIGLIQENSIENSVQDCLPYILNYYGSCYYFSSLP